MIDVMEEGGQGDKRQFLGLNVANHIFQFRRGLGSLRAPEIIREAGDDLAENVPVEVGDVALFIFSIALEAAPRPAPCKFFHEYPLSSYRFSIGVDPCRVSA